MVAAQDLSLLANEPSDLLGSSTEIVPRHEKIAVLVLTSESGGYITPGTTEIGAHVLANGNRDGLDRQNLILQNPNCSTPLSPETLDKVRLAFSL